MSKPEYRLEVGGDGLTYLTHWALLFATAEAVLIDLATVIREDGLQSDALYYRCVEIKSSTGEHIRVVWTLSINQ